MGARQKLNSANVYAILVIAGIAGLLTGSWGVFLVLAGILAIGALHSGDIRLNVRRHRSRRRRRR